MIEVNQIQQPLIIDDDEDEDSRPGWASLEAAQQTPDERIQEGLNEMRAKDWLRNLERSSFNGDVEKGNVMMKSLSEGSADVIEALRRRNKVPDDFKIPLIRLVQSEEGKQFDAHANLTYVEKEGKKKLVQASIDCNPDFVEKLCSRSLEEITENTAQITGEVVTSGRAQDIAYLAGVEEAAHIVFRTNEASEGKESSYVGQHAVDSVAAYDAQDEEYHGLGWQIKMVMDAQKTGKFSQDVSEQVLKPLQARMQRAIEVRQKLKAEIG